MTDTAILARQVGLLYRNTTLGQAITVINAGLLAWVWHESVGFDSAFAWWVAVIAVAGGRVVVAQKYLHADPENQLRAAAWLNAALAGAAMAGLVWTAGALLFMLRGSTVQALFTAFVMAGMVAGAVPILGAHRLAFRLYAWPIVFAVMAASAGTDAMHLAFEVMALLFLLGLSRSADYFHDALLETFRLELEKDRLLVDLGKAKQLAESSDRAKTQFLANISHELRTPMNGIMGMADLLAMEDLRPEQQELLVPLKQSADELLQKIDHMIELSALEVGKPTLRPAPFSPQELISAVADQYQQAAREKGLALSPRPDANLPAVVIGDMALVHKLLQHVVDNAVKFTLAGCIDITAGLAGSSPGTIRLILTIRDTGPGIAADQLESVFGLFSQADGSATRRHGGTGIGLPIARRLAEALGGTLDIDSQVGSGTAVRVTLPFQLPSD